jgi:hypothetical protein
MRFGRGLQPRIERRADRYVAIAGTGELQIWSATQSAK